MGVGGGGKWPGEGNNHSKVRGPFSETALARCRNSGRETLPSYPPPYPHPPTPPKKLPTSLPGMSRGSVGLFFLRWLLAVMMAAGRNL